MYKLNYKLITLLVLMLSSLNHSIMAQSTAEWHQDIDLLTSKIEKYHPMPFSKITKKQFYNRVDNIKSHLNEWGNEMIVVELMQLVSMLMDGHSEILINNQANFNLWFPVRMEKFKEGIFITAVDSLNSELLGAQVLKIGSMDASAAYQKVGTVVPKDSEFSEQKTVSNYIVNAVILKNLDIIENEKQLDIEVLLNNGIKKKVIIKSSPWRMRNNWSWGKIAVPTFNKSVSIFDEKLSSLPIYLAKIVPSRIPYWFEFYPNDKLLYFQFNSVSNWSEDPFLDFSERLFKTFDENTSGINRFVIDVRFNEGGNGYMLPPLVNNFISREKSFANCKLYIVTGSKTFSAAPNFIGQMKKYTNVITVGDIASGPLNWYSDVIDFLLPNSNLILELSTMYWQTGHATDNRGYYPPDYYIPLTFKDYVSFSDPVLDAIKTDQVISLKEILIKEGADLFFNECIRRKGLYGEYENWFPYTSFDLIMFSYFNLISEKRFDEALQILKFNTELNPEDFRAWYALAEISKETGKIKEAIEVYKKLFSVEPGIAETIVDYNKLLLFDTYTSKGINELADKFKEMKKAYPNLLNDGTLNNLGYMMMNENKLQDAIKIFELNTDLYSTSANAFNSLAEAYLKEGNQKLAIKNYKKSLELNPNNLNAKKMLEDLMKE